MIAFDLISEVFSSLRIHSELYFRAQLCGPLAVRLPEEAGHIRFHVVLHGACWIDVAGVPSTLLNEGDIALVPNGAGQVLATEPGAASTPLAEAIAGGALQNGLLSAGTGPVRADLICGFCRFEAGASHPAVTNLPPLIHLPASGLGAEPWVGATLRLLGLEANLDAQGTTAILGRLIEIVVIQATRRLQVNRPGNGFSAALADPALSQALLAIHRTPQRDWRVGDLAQVAGMSRASFAERFTGTVGMPPIEYLTEWRLLRARSLLIESDLSLEAVAERCGYASLPSFSRRFKMRFSVGPGAFRRTHRVIGRRERGGASG